MKATTYLSKVVCCMLILVVVSSCKPMQSKKLKHSSMDSEVAQPNTYAVANLSLVPLRAEPNHRSEMLTQVLFGEFMKILQKADDWSYVALEQDSYKGWIETSQILSSSQSDYEKCAANPKVKVVDEQAIININGTRVQLVKGTNLDRFSADYFIFNGNKIPFSGETFSGKKDREQIVATAYSYLNVPYLWGGKTMNGVDCSGFTQMVYHLNGYSIQRDAYLQAKQGQLVAFLEQANQGDLAFFDNEEANITHVGIILEEQKIVHAAKGKVRIDSLDQEGIYNNELKKYTHHLRMVRCYF